MLKLGLDYSSVSKFNPKIIYLRTYGYSQEGPYASLPAYDDLIQGMCGIPWPMQKSGANEPRYIPATISEQIEGVYAASAITTALYYREKTDLFYQDERFNSHEQRAKRIDEVYEFVELEIRKKSTGQWRLALLEADIPHAPVNSLDS